MKTMTSVISRRKPLLPIAAAIAVMDIPESGTEFVILAVMVAEEWSPCMSIYCNIMIATQHTPLSGKRGRV